jgi:hypothetical protein
MHEKPLLNKYQTSSEPKPEREKQKRDEEKKLNYRLDKHGKKGESTYIPKGNWEKKFQNNCEALAGIPQAEIDQHKTDKASCWHCGHNSHHTLKYFAKKTSKGTELATIVVAVSKRTK